MKKLLIVILCILLFGSFVGCSSNANQTTSDKGTENIIELNIGFPTYEHVGISVNIIQQIAEELGYKVNLVDGEMGFMYLGLAQGDIDIFSDIWSPSLHESYLEKYKDDIEITGTMTKDVPLGLAVPTDVPFDSVNDLKDETNAALIGNQIIGIEPSTGMNLTSKKLIEAYELEDLIELIDGSTPAMLSELDTAISMDEPILFTAWRPHTMFTEYDIKMLEDPKEIFALNDICIGTNPSLKEKAPDMYHFLQQFKLSIEDLEEMLFKMKEGEKVEDLTKQWVEDHRTEIDDMIK